MVRNAETPSRASRERGDGWDVRRGEMSVAKAEDMFERAVALSDGEARVRRSDGRRRGVVRGVCGGQMGVAAVSRASRDVLGAQANGGG